MNLRASRKLLTSSIGAKYGMMFSCILLILEVDRGCGGCWVQASVPHACQVEGGVDHESLSRRAQLRSQLRLTIFVLGQRGASASAIALMALQNAPEAVPSSLFIWSSSGV